MLFDPSSSFDSVKANIRFLREICGDGSSPAVFCKMLPYAETDVEKNLLQERRLKGTVLSPNYSFLSPKLDEFYEYMYKIFYDWMFVPASLASRLRLRRLEIAVMEKFYPELKNLEEYKNFLKELIASSNESLFQAFERTIAVFEQNPIDIYTQLEAFSQFQRAELLRINEQINRGIEAFQNCQT
jgi:anaerobic magnesium-protoporphyrin IX monomethyl ester cyclase